MSRIHAEKNVEKIGVKYENVANSTMLPPIGPNCSVTLRINPTIKLHNKMAEQPATVYLYEVFNLTVS